MPLNLVLEKTLERPLNCKEFQPVHPKGDQSWMFIGRTDVKLKLQYFGHWWEDLTHWKRPWCWERLRAGGEEDDRGWGGWMASLAQWRWVWVNSGSWWWTGRPGMLQFMGSQRVGHTEWLKWLILVSLASLAISVSCNGPFSPFSRWEDSRFVSRLNLGTFSYLHPLSRWFHPVPWLFWPSLVW